MKAILIYGFVVSALIISGSCGSKSKPPAPPTEANLTVTLTPPENSTQAPVPQTDFPLVVTVTSTMPSQGITISVNSKKDDGSGTAPFFTTNSSTSSPTSNFTITNTPTSVVCLTTVTVTSKSKASNTWTGTYRYSRKP